MRAALITMAAVGLLLAGMGCHRKEARLPDAWMVNPPAGFDSSSFKRIDPDDITPVRPDQAQSALTKLSEKSAVRLTGEELKTLAAPGAKPPKANSDAYLVRCLASAGYVQQCRPRRNGDVLWMNSGILSHSDVAPDHAALILFLDRAPKMVYITFSVAE